MPSGCLMPPPVDTPATCVQMPRLGLRQWPYRSRHTMADILRKFQVGGGDWGLLLSESRVQGSSTAGAAPACSSSAEAALPPPQPHTSACCCCPPPQAYVHGKLGECAALHGYRSKVLALAGELERLNAALRSSATGAGACQSRDAAPSLPARVVPWLRARCPRTLCPAPAPAAAAHLELARGGALYKLRQELYKLKADEARLDGEGRGQRDAPQRSQRAPSGQRSSSRHLHHVAPCALCRRLRCSGQQVA